MARKYLKWGETREVPKPPEAPMPTLTPLDSFDTPLYLSESDAAREAREQSRRVLEKRHKGR
jgi:hypothetical protein